MCAACQRGAGLQTSYSFPKGFIWGAAISAYQTEGNNINSDWDRAAQEGTYPVNGEATRYYTLFDADHERAASLGLTMFRISIEWARIEPSPGVYDEAEIAHYRSVLESLHKRGLRPIVTLHHFTNPLWLADDGGWRSAQLKERFTEYARLMASRFGDLVDFWSTLNEPMIYIAGVYLVNQFPGGEILNMEGLKEGYVNMAFTHAAAVEAIRDADTVDTDGDGSPAQIVLVQAYTPTDPVDPDDPSDIEAAKRYNLFQNTSFLDTWVKGRLDYDFDGLLETTSPFPEGIYDELAGSVDIIGFTYYSRTFVMDSPGTLPPVNALPCLLELMCNRSFALQGDNDREVYPRGIYRSIRDIASYGLPIFIVENGVADKVGNLRARFTVMHLMQVARALSEGFNVLGYLHWSLTDNYEWAQGYDMRFGLYHVDYGTQERTLTEGGSVYSEIVKANSIPSELIELYNVPEINPLNGN